MVPHDRNVDLHMHSSASDGVLSPRDLVARGVANGLEVMALTDHDTLDGLSEAAEAASDLGIRFVPGVEVSVTWAGETLHVLGLGVNPKAPSLAGALREMQRSRGQRAQQMDDALVAAGLPSVLSQALGYAGNPLLVGRTHFARALVARGVCGQIQEVFDRYLTPGKPGYVVHHWARLSEAMAWIQEAGGTPVLAHPARYRLSETARWALLQEFRTLGGRAIEVSTGSHTKEDTRRYQQIALQWGMRASRGSDFHSPTESRCDVGRAPPLPDGCDPVWAYW